MAYWVKKVWGFKNEGFVYLYTVQIKQIGCYFVRALIFLRITVSSWQSSTSNMWFGWIPLEPRRTMKHWTDSVLSKQASTAKYLYVIIGHCPANNKTTLNERLTVFLVINKLQQFHSIYRLRRIRNVFGVFN